MKIIVSTSLVVLSLFVISPVLAHVVVRPNQAGVGAFQTFTVGVPSEKEIATVGVRLLIPEGVQSVTPNVKPGWTIEMKRTGTGEEATVTELIWKGGSIPAHHRDDFLFSARVPGTATTLSWKAYQTYQDGSVVFWDRDPKAEQPKDATGKNDFSRVGPFSQTKVVNDLQQSPSPSPTAPSPTPSNVSDAPSSARMAFPMAAFALIISFVSLILSFRKRG